jgi:hypothetical protein
MALVDINLIPDSSGGSFDFKNDSGAAIPAGSLFVQGELTGYISTQVGDTPSVEPEDLGTFRFAGASQIFTAPLDPLAADNYAIGERVSVLAGEIVPLGTVSEVLVPLVAVGKNDPVMGAGSSAGLTAANGAAAAGDSYIRVALLGAADAVLPLAP